MKNQSITCEFCEMTFKSTSGLKKHHYRKHSTKEAKTCELCGKKFPDTFAVTRHHQIVHLGLKPYHCKFCEETFSGVSNMKRHELTKHTDPEGLLKKHACDKCDFKSYDKYALVNHQKKKNGCGLSLKNRIK